MDSDISLFLKLQELIRYTLNIVVTLVTTYVYFSEKGIRMTIQ